MRHYVTNLCLFVITLIVIFSICVLTCSAKMTQYIFDKETAIVVSRGDDALDNAESAITKSLNDASIIATRTAYSSITNEFYNEGIQITEDAANDLFVKRYLDSLKAVYDSPSGNINGEFEALLPTPYTGDLSMDSEHEPLFVITDDSVTVKDITVRYNYENLYSDKRIFEVELPIKRIMLYDENPDFFTYALVAKKGLYITGQTSTILGNVYAGTHEPTETRQAEALYGEKNFYGGININATQLALYSDKIVTNGALNMKGSFVLLGSDDSPANIFARKINQIDTIASRNTYVHVGTYKEISSDFPEISMINSAISTIDDIDVLYDTLNDGGYMGSMRKIISPFDVEIAEDIEGIVITPKNVIIEEGVNIAGMVIAGDRIYMQGNNNIIASPDIMRKIVKEELHGNNELEQEYMHIHASDYIGGIESRGIK